jgi:hypothetical protein
MHGYRGKIRKKYALGIKRKMRWKNTEYKHRIQSHDAHRHGNHEYEGWENIKI